MITTKYGIFICASKKEKNKQNFIRHHICFHPTLNLLQTKELKINLQAPFSHSSYLTGLSLVPSKLKGKANLFVSLI